MFHRPSLWLIRVLFAALLLGTSGAVWATGVFEQSDWSLHAADPDNTTAGHPSDQAGWRRYATAPGHVNAADTVSLRWSRTPVVFTTDADFGAGTLTDVEVSGQGGAAALVLAGAGAMGSGGAGDLIIDGTDGADSTDGLAYPLAALASPTGVTAVLDGTTGGDLAAGAHVYRITAINGTGETAATASPTVTVSAYGQNVLVQWAQVACAAGYRVYRDGGRIAQLPRASSPSFTDDGALAADLGVPPPTANTTVRRPYVVSGPLEVARLTVQNCAEVKAGASQDMLNPTGLRAQTFDGGGAIAAGTYFYTVRAFDAAHLRTRGGAQLQHSVLLDGASVQLTWDAVTDAAGYEVYRSAQAGVYADPSLVCTSSSTSCIDNLAAPAAGQPPTDENPQRGGRVIVRSLSSIAIDGTSLVHANAAGYRGTSNGAERGRSYRGDATTGANANYSGGGGSIAGAGGGHGARGQDGYDSASFLCSGGATWGTPGLEILTIGSAGGNGYYGTSGAGGGAIELRAAGSILVNGRVEAQGGAGLDRAAGGSGGALKLLAPTVTLTASSVLDVRGGSRGWPCCSLNPGSGGGGRVALYTTSGAAARNGLIQLGTGALTGTLYEGAIGTIATSGNFVSTPKDVGGTIAQLGQVVVTADVPPGAAVRVRVATSADGETFSPFVGPDCSPATFYGPGTGALCAEHAGDRYLQVTAELDIAGAQASPLVHEVRVDVTTLRTPGELVSSAYNSGDPTVRWFSPRWVAATPAGSVVELQLRTAPDVSGIPGSWGPWLGPTGSGPADSWYSDAGGGEPINPGHSDMIDDQWVQYRVRLSTTGITSAALQQVLLGYQSTRGVDLILSGDGRGELGAPGSGAGGDARVTAAGGSTATFTLEVENTGELADVVVVTFAAPLGFSATLDGQPSPGILSLAAGGRVALPFAVTSPGDAIGVDVPFYLEAQSQADGSKTDSVLATLQVEANRPAGVVSALSPADNAVAVQLDGQLCWLKPAGTDPIGYQVQLAGDPIFNALLLDVGGDEASYTDTCVSPPALLAPATRYYWRVRSGNPYFGTRPWPFTPFRFETGFPPLAPQLLYPAPDAERTPLAFGLTWLAPMGGPGSQPACFMVGVGATDDEAKVAAQPVPGCGTSSPLGPLAFETTYRWCVAGWNAFGDSPWTCAGFTTGSREVPAPPDWLTPAAGDREVPLAAVLSWRAGVSGPLPTTYEVGLGLAEDDAIATATAIAATQWRPATLAQSTAYHACVRGLVDIYPGPWSCLAFTTGEVPGVPTTVYPANEARDLPAATVRLLWSAPLVGAPPVGYRVALWDEARPLTTLQEFVTTARWAEVQLQPATTYQWHVSAFNGVGDGLASATVSFTTIAAADALRAVIAITPERGVERHTHFAFDGSASTSRRDAPITQWQWDVGDGSPPLLGTGAAYVYPAAGGYQITLRVEDESGASNEARWPLAVLTQDGRVPPLIRAEVSTPRGVAPHTTRLNVALVSGSADIEAVVWQFNDGSLGEGREVEHTFVAPGSYLVRVTAVDVQGLTATDAVLIAATDAAGNADPTVHVYAQPLVAEIGESVQLTCAARGTPGSLLQLEWALPGDATSSEMRPEPLVFDQAGVYAAACTATDLVTAISSRDAVEIIVRAADGSLPPRILTVPSTTVCAGEPYLYNDRRRAAARGTMPLRWSAGRIIGDALMGAPEGFVVNDSGLISWTPTVAQVGTQKVVLIVENTGGRDLQEFDVEVSDCSPPAPKAADEGCDCRQSGAMPTGLVLMLLGLVRARPRRSRR